MLQMLFEALIDLQLSVGQCYPTLLYQFACSLLG